jgi:hypothetical protein
MPENSSTLAEAEGNSTTKTMKNDSIPGWSPQNISVIYLTTWVVQRLCKHKDASDQKR